MGAPRLLPIFDDVNLKAVFSVSVAHAREARVLSNMPLNVSTNTCVIFILLIAAVSTRRLGRPRLSTQSCR